MKKHNIFSTLATVFFLVSFLVASMTACDNMPDKDALGKPPVKEDPDPDPEPEPGKRYVKYVKVDGAGLKDGTSWDNAISAEALADSLRKDIFLSKDTICMAAGTYRLQTEITEANQDNLEFRIKKTLTFLGGFPADITGNEVEIAYPSQHKTVISGDRNGDDTPNAGDVRTLSIRAGHAIFKGFEITGGYLSQYDGAGVSVEGEAVIGEFHYCKIHGNVSAGRGGGVFLKDGNLYMYKSEIVDNNADNRGGGFVLSGGNLYLESCLIARNRISGDFGSAIHNPGDGSNIYMANTTITDNHVGNWGGAVNSSNNGKKMVIISSTIAGNTQTTLTHNQGIDFRCENKDLSIINSVVTNSNADNYSFFITSANETFVTSGGGNVIGLITGDQFYGDATDNTQKLFSAVFSSGALADNGGYPQTLLTRGTYSGASVADLTTFYNSKVADPKFVFDVAVDQRGMARNADAATPGACEATDGDNFNNTVTTDPVEDIDLSGEGW